jgi:uncharacterized protein YegL
MNLSEHGLALEHLATATQKRHLDFSKGNKEECRLAVVQLVSNNGDQQMPYKKLPIGMNQPGLIVVLIDQSASMANPYGGGGMSKKEFAALAVNRCIYAIMNACKAGESIKDRCHIGVIGYGKVTEVLVGGNPSQLGALVKRTQVSKKKVPDRAGSLVEIEERLPIWIEPRAENGTPLHVAFDLTAELIDAWINENPDNFPPVVINITDGEPNNRSQAETAARRLLSLATSDGNVLLLNAHIADAAAQEIKLPSDENGLPNDFARLLYQISSVLPKPMLDAAVNAGFAPSPAARGLIVNASTETLTNLIAFGSWLASA